MLIQHFNEQAQVHRYNCSNLLLQVSVVGFFAGSFATRLGGTCEAKVICVHMRQSVCGRDKIAALTNESRRQGVHFSTLGPSKQTLTFWSLESRQEGILHDGVGYLTLCQIKLLSSTEFPPNYCINIPQVSFNVF